MSLGVKMLRGLLILRQTSQRTINTTSCRQFKNRVPEKQKLFQEDNGLPVYLKGGVMDHLLYRTTMAITIFGSVYGLYELYAAAMPKKQQ
ncbi:cytochrome c oxidase subunit 7A2, mitochondrial [Alligator mississippiensis]|uniref:Cytochrome c oxidase subunit 7A2, mitochondrial n=1 Tax=Alligator mississippiensis TaxID=8496 RepID=A0A151MU75_ALLMI|nr:cytochrome c oxidase subunit 7A2, mitochondrial [Alligator mississippiensis]KYO28047.1 cytochrome c oxidase subunit 7A2, mitochondrial [Alligator mississippiensis]